MSIRLVGELLTPISCPMAGVTIHLKALDTSASVLFSSEASVKTDYKGRYEFTVPTGLYLVSLDNGISSAELGQIQVYSDSAESTLQALLDAPQTEPSPVWLQQLEEKLAEATRQAGLAAQSASEAANTAKSVTETADAAKQHADRAYASSTSASQSKLDAEDAATRAELAAKSSETNANSASDSASEARVSSDQSASNASSASQSAIDAEASASRVEEAAKSSEANAANAATSASNAAKSESNSAASESSAADSARVAEEAAIEALHNATQAYNRGGVFKITASQEYPDISGITRDTLWIIQINPDSDPAASYTFKSGSLKDKIVRQGWQLIYDTPSNDWYIVPTGASAVVSVNGKHGDVVLDAVDVGAAKGGNDEINVASFMSTKNGGSDWVIIKTNVNYGRGAIFSLHLKGNGGFGTSYTRPFSAKFGWYFYNNAWYIPSASIECAHEVPNPVWHLANMDGKVALIIGGSYFARFTVSLVNTSGSSGLSGEELNGWTCIEASDSEVSHLPNRSSYTLGRVYNTAFKPTPAEIGIRTHVIDSNETSTSDTKYWWRKWNDGFVEQGGWSHTSILERDEYGCPILRPPVPVDLSRPFNLCSVGANVTSTYVWEAGGDPFRGYLRGRWYIRGTSDKAPDSHNDYINWSASGFYK